MSTDPNNPDLDGPKPAPEVAEGLVPDQIEIEVPDPTITNDFNEADFDHEFDDDFEEEFEGEYDLEDDQYGEDFRKEFGHLTEDEDKNDSDVK